jgi:succinate dehydrogenase / fumarate reductase flavoprotein subunit
VSYTVRKFDAVIVGAGGAGLRAAIQLSEAGYEDGCADQGFPDPLAHRGGAGRRRRESRQLRRKTTGTGTCTTPSRGRTGWATRMRSSSWSRRPMKSWSSSNTTACPSTARQRQDLSASLWWPHRQNFGETPVRRSCAAADRTGHAMLHAMYQRNVKANTQFFVEWMALDLIRDAEGDVSASRRWKWKPARSSSSMPRPPFSPPAELGASITAPPMPSSTPATVSAWRRVPAFRWKTWSSGSSTRPAWPVPAC